MANYQLCTKVPTLKNDFKVTNKFVPSRGP